MFIVHKTCHLYMPHLTLSGKSIWHVILVTEAKNLGMAYKLQYDHISTGMS